MSEQDVAVIEQLKFQWQRALSDLPNEGNRLSIARTHFDQAIYWLRVNLDVHEARNDR